jgi:tetratricopeptide (TPR) repeat protein
VLSLAGDLTGAARQYRAAIHLIPRQATFHRSLGSLLLQQNLPEEAVKELRIATDLDPTSSSAQYSLAMALQRVGRSEEAAPLIKEAQFVKQEELSKQQATIKLNMGIDHLKSGRVDRAMESFQSALEIKPYFPEAHYYLGMALAEKNDLEGAAEQFQRALAERPSDLEMRYNFAILLWRRGKLEEAEKEFRWVITQKSDNGEAHCQLARLLLARGQSSEGQRALERARQLGHCGT